MRKLFASIFFTIWFAFFLQLVNPLVELYGKWDDFAGEGKEIVDGQIVRFDPTLDNHRTDSKYYDIDREENAYKFYVDKNKLRLQPHAWWFVNHWYGKSRWCVYPAIAAANLSSRIVDAAPWFLGATIIWIGLWFFFFKQIKKRPDTSPEKYLPIYYRVPLIVVYVVVYLLVNGRLFDNERSTLLITLTLAIIMGAIEIMRFILHSLNRISGVPFALTYMQRNAENESKTQKGRSAISRWFGRHFRA